MLYHCLVGIKRYSCQDWLHLTTPCQGMGNQIVFDGTVWNSRGDLASSSSILRAKTGRTVHSLSGSRSTHLGHWTTSLGLWGYGWDRCWWQLASIAGQAIWRIHDSSVLWAFTFPHAVNFHHQLDRVASPKAIVQLPLVAVQSGIRQGETHSHIYSTTM